MKPLERILLILKTIAPILILLVAISCSNSNDPNKTADQNQSGDEHIHDEAEVHDDHDHDLHDEAEHDEVQSMNMSTLKPKYMMIMIMTSMTRPITMNTPMSMFTLKLKCMMTDTTP